MKLKNFIGFCIAGSVAGTINGLFGAGGGMVLVPSLTRFTDIEENHVFPCSISIILPICIISLCTSIDSGLPMQEAWPYLVGGIVGGLLSFQFSHLIPTKYLHRILGILILWGGVRYLC